MRNVHLFLFALFTLPAAACGGDADVTASLELRVDLPAAAGSAAHALVEVARDGAPFDLFEAEPLASVPLGSARSEDAISVVTADATPDLKVRVRFCAAAGCIGEDAAPAQRFQLRDPFYTGERTFHRIFAEDPAIDVPDPIEVGRCQIRGCVESDLSSYCDTTGMHFCEIPHAEGPAPGAISARVIEI